VLNSRSGSFIPGERVPDTNWIGGWVDPRASLNAMGRETFSTPAGNLTMIFQSVS